MARIPVTNRAAMVSVPRVENNSQAGRVWLALRPDEVRTRLEKLGWVEARPEPGLFPHVGAHEPLDRVFVDESVSGRLLLWRLDERWWTPPGVFPCRLDLTISELGPRLTELRWEHRLHDFAVMNELLRRTVGALPVIALTTLFILPLLLFSEGAWMLFVAVQAVLMALGVVALVAYKRCEQAQDVTQRLYSTVYAAIEADTVDPGAGYRG